MADNNLSASAEPDVTTPAQSYDEQVEDLSNLLDDPVTDPVTDDQDEAAAPVEPEAEEEDPLFAEDDAEDVGTEDADETDGSEEPEIKGGRFAPDSAKVTLDDGSVITVADLKRNNLFQRDYTKKTTELKAQETEVQTLRSEVDQYAQSLNQSREYLAWYAETFLPKDPGATFPGNAAADPYGYQQWSSQRDEWLAHQQAYHAFQQQKTQDEQRKTGETQKQANERLKREQEALFRVLPVLKDPKKGPQAWNTLVSGAVEHYGFSEQEVNALQDHRFAIVFRDALKAKRIEAGAKSVPAAVAQRPPVRPGKRAAPDARVSQGKQVRSERLRNGGSFEDGVAALQDLDL